MEWFLLGAALSLPGGLIAGGALGVVLGCVSRRDHRCRHPRFEPEPRPVPAIAHRLEPNPVPVINIVLPAVGYHPGQWPNPAVVPAVRKQPPVLLSGPRP